MDTPILTPQLNQLQNPLEDAYLRFQLEQQTDAILPMEYAQEVLIVPQGRITPMPNMPTCVLGLLNRRGRVLWVIDLAQMLNLHHDGTNLRQYNVIIIRVGSVILGLVVQAVKGTTRLMSDSIQSPFRQVASSLQPYLRGYVLQQDEILLVLDAQAIVQSSIFQHN